VVYLRIYLGQMPFVLDKERTVVFGLQASPTKPMEKGWRTRTFASGVGPVVCWGGIACSSKYPDQRDFTIVDKIQEARRTGKVDRAWFEERDKQRVNPNEKVHGSTQWLSSVLHFADFASRSGHGGSGTYFEEHSTHQGKPEWGVFQDEWGMLDFTRFQDPQMHWGVARESYRDFTLYYANEWMKRGVSLYFDNTYTKISRNRRFTDAYLPPEGTLPRWSPIQWSTEIFGPRRYYRRIWKLAKEWNMKGAPYPIDVTYHMTNTAILPFSTWCTAVLELEQENRNIPWPTDYVRAVILQRRAGNITCVLDYLTGQARNFVGPDNPPEMVLTSWGMSKVHDARGGYMEWDSKFKALAAIYDKALLDFGYGEDDVAHYNYWDEKPFAQVSDDHVKWLAMTRPGEQPRAMILLQSYRKEEAKARVTVPGAVRCKEIHTGEELTADDKGAVEVILPANYGTRMYLIDIK